MYSHSVGEGFGFSGVGAGGVVSAVTVQVTPRFANAPRMIPHGNTT